MIMPSMDFYYDSAYGQPRKKSVKKNKAFSICRLALKSRIGIDSCAEWRELADNQIAQILSIRSEIDCNKLSFTIFIKVRNTFCVESAFIVEIWVRTSSDLSLFVDEKASHESVTYQNGVKGFLLFAPNKRDRFQKVSVDFGNVAVGFEREISVNLSLVTNFIKPIGFSDFAFLMAKGDWRVALAALTAQITYRPSSDFLRPVPSLYTPIVFTDGNKQKISKVVKKLAEVVSVLFVSENLDPRVIRTCRNEIKHVVLIGGTFEDILNRIKEIARIFPKPLKDVFVIPPYADLALVVGACAKYLNAEVLVLESGVDHLVSQIVQLSPQNVTLVSHKMEDLAELRAELSRFANVNITDYVGDVYEINSRLMRTFVETYAKDYFLLQSKRKVFSPRNSVRESENRVNLVSPVLYSPPCTFLVHFDEELEHIFAATSICVARNGCLLLMKPPTSAELSRIRNLLENIDTYWHDYNSKLTQMINNRKAGSHFRARVEKARKLLENALMRLTIEITRSTMSEETSQLFHYLYKRYLLVFEPTGLIPYELLSFRDKQGLFRSLGNMAAIGRITTESSLEVTLFAINTLLAEDGLRKKKLRIAVFANPEGDLPLAEKEGQALHTTFALFGNSVLFVKEKANMEEFVQQIPKRDIIFCSQHAYFREFQNGIVTGLRFSDGMLSIRQIQSLPLAGKIFFLNSCVSGVLGHRQNLSLASSFIKAGAIAAIGTLWSVADRSAAFLGVEFKENIFTNSLGWCLQEAKWNASTVFADLSWPSYIFLGDPCLKITEGASAEFFEEAILHEGVARLESNVDRYRTAIKIYRRASDLFHAQAVISKDSDVRRASYARHFDSEGFAFAAQGYYLRDHLEHKAASRCFGRASKLFKRSSTYYANDILNRKAAMADSYVMLGFQASTLHSQAEERQRWKRAIHYCTKAHEAFLLARKMDQRLLPNRLAKALSLYMLAARTYNKAVLELNIEKRFQQAASDFIRASHLYKLSANLTYEYEQQAQAMAFVHISQFWAECSRWTMDHNLDHLARAYAEFRKAERLRARAKDPRRRHALVALYKNMESVRVIVLKKSLHAKAAPYDSDWAMLVETARLKKPLILVSHDGIDSTAIDSALLKAGRLQNEVPGSCLLVYVLGDLKSYLGTLYVMSGIPQNIRKRILQIAQQLDIITNL